MRLLVSALQGRLVEVYFGFKKWRRSCIPILTLRSGKNTWFERLYTKILRLSQLLGSAEKRPRGNRRGNRSSRNGEGALGVRYSNTVFRHSFIGIEVPFQPGKFSCLRRLQPWLRSTMTRYKPSDLSVVTMHGKTMVAQETDSICWAFKELNPRMTEPSLLGQ